LSAERRPFRFADPGYVADTPMCAFNEVGLLQHIDSRRGPHDRDAGAGMLHIAPCAYGRA